MNVTKKEKKCKKGLCACMQKEEERKAEMAITWGGSRHDSVQNQLALNVFIL